MKENTLNDTVYVLNSDNSITPKYVVNAGKHEITPDIRGAVGRFSEAAENYVGIINIQEVKDFLFFWYRHKTLPVFCYYDKQTNELLYFNSKENIPNDYDGGFDFWPFRCGQRNNDWYAFYDANLFCERSELSFSKIGSRG